MTPEVYAPSSLDRFWAKVDRNGPIPAHRPELGPCWMWTAADNGRGYGNLSVNGHRWLAHRFSYTIAHGPIPDGLDVLHACDNPPCVRPEHLWVGTAKDNGRDMAQKGRVSPASNASLRANWTPDVLARGDAHWSRQRPESFPRGERHGATKLTAAAVVEIRQRHAGGETQDSLAEAYSVRQATIWAIVRRKTWTHI